MTLIKRQSVTRNQHLKHLFILAISLLISFSCKKDEIPEPEDEDEEVVEEETGCGGIYETIITNIEGGTYESGTYLAAYPGSWWTFSNEDHLTCEMGSTDIIEFISRNHETCEEFYNYTNVTLPQIIGNYTPNSGDGFIYVDSILVDIGEATVNTVFAQQISTEVGSQWYEFIDNTHAYENPWYTFYPEREVTEHYDSLELPNGNWFYDVLKISQVLGYDGKDGEWLAGYYHLYYANEIGLIWEKNILVPDYDRYLEDYYIAPH